MKMRLSQLLFRVVKYCLNVKKAVRMIDSFAICPVYYKNKVDAIFAKVGKDSADACMQLKLLIDETKELLAKL